MSHIAINNPVIYPKNYRVQFNEWKQMNRDLRFTADTTTLSGVPGHPPSFITRIFLQTPNGPHGIAQGSGWSKKAAQEAAAYAALHTLTTTVASEPGSSTARENLMAKLISS